MPEIAIQIPVLNRPQNAHRVVSSIFANTTVEVEVVFVCSPGDDDEIAACLATGEEVIVVPWACGPGDFARKHNLAYKHTRAPLILLAADDLEFEPDWDTKVIAVYERRLCGVIGTQDDANPLVKRGKHATHAVVSRHYIDRVGGTWHDGPGVIYHEGYAHQYVDTELVAAASERDEWAFAHGAVVRHLHPIFNRAVAMDDTYRKALEDGQLDRQLYMQRQARAQGPKR
jgi:glycosyltransferase involved in cell wall biosynthesis